MILSIRHWLAERHIDLTQLGHQNAQIGGIAFRLAQDMEVKSLNVFAVSALTDVLELPLKAACLAAPAISQVTVGLLRILSRKKPLKRNEGTWLTFQVAYLNAIQGILEQEALVGRPWMNRAEVPVGLDADEPLDDPQLMALLKTLRPGRLSDSQAEQALTLVADSFLVQQMNSLAIAWFVANGAEETEAKLLVQRLSNGFLGYLLTVIAESPLPLAQLQKFVRLGNLSAWRDTPTPENAADQTELSTATLPLNLDREYYRAGLLQSLSAPLLAEPFSLKDIYIPLKGKSYELGEPSSIQNSELKTQNSQSPPVDLMEWAMSHLQDKTTIAIIEAELGGGKTSFCQMWAARVAQELYPSWMPVVIPLSQATLGQTLEQTLESAFPIGRFTDTDGWLSLNSPPCLLILDGLDELPRSSHRSNHLWSFVDQLLRFHGQNIGSNGQPRHKLVLTSRPATLDCLTRKYRQSTTFSTFPLANLLRRIAIAPLGHDEFRQWFQDWAKLQSKAIAQAYFSFLKHGGVFQQHSNAKELATLVKRPLMLYLLGILHRDGLLDESIFQMSSPQLLFEIYDRMTRWLLGEAAASNSPLPELTREGLAHAARSQEAIANLLAGRHPQELRHQMQVAALTLIQTGRSQVPQAVIQNRLTPNSTSDVLTQPLPAFFFRSQPAKLMGERGRAGEWESGRAGEWESGRAGEWESGRAGEWESGRAGEWESGRAGEWERGRGEEGKFVKNMPASSSRLPIIEFSHSSLGEYLGAEEIAAQLIALTRQVRDRYGEVAFVIPDEVNVARHLYALLGYGIVSPEVEVLAIERVRREEKRNADAFSFSVLFKRLYHFYRAYCQGRWLNEGIAHQSYQELEAFHNPLNVLQIDAAVGLNVFLLLCSAAKEAQIPFFPCGQPNIPQDFDADQLLSFIGRTVALDPTVFWQRARLSLSKVQLLDACLNEAMLAEANLSQANLSGAELIGSNLAAANLQDTNLSWATLVNADLSNANLCGASLEGADLSGANLKGANLKSANLANACLFEAQLDEQSKTFAIRSGAIFSLQVFQAYHQSLLPTQLTDDLDSNGFIEDEPTIFIESAEGEPMLPDASHKHDRDDYYDGETAQIEDSD